MGDDIVGLSTENKCLKNEIGCYDENWLEETKTKLLKQTYDGKGTNLIMTRMQKQMKKQIIKWLLNLIINNGRVNLITSFRKEKSYEI